MKGFYFLLCGLVLQMPVFGQTQSIEIKVLDTQSGQILENMGIAIYKGLDQVVSARSDMQGRFKYTLDPGIYTLEFFKKGYRFCIVRDYEMAVNTDSYFEVKMEQCNMLCCETEVMIWKRPLYNPENLASGQFFPAEQIRHLY